MLIFFVVYNSMDTGEYCAQSQSKSTLAGKKQESMCAASPDMMCVSLDTVFKSKRSLAACSVNL